MSIKFKLIKKYLKIVKITRIDTINKIKKKYINEVIKIRLHKLTDKFIK